MSVHGLCAMLVGCRRGHQGTGVSGGCELLFGCLDLNLKPLGEQPVIFFLNLLIYFIYMTALSTLCQKRISDPIYRWL